jgi:hypothetical protein
MNFNTNFVFDPGKLTTVLDSQLKGACEAKITSFITEHADNWQFCCHAFTPRVDNIIMANNGMKYRYQTLNSCAYNHKKFEKMYIGCRGVIILDTLLSEIEINNIPREKLGISPTTIILQKNKNVLLAKNVPELKDFVCDVSGEIIKRLNSGQSGLLEIAVEFGNILDGTYGNNYTNICAGLNNMRLPPIYAGNVILNNRTYPTKFNFNWYPDQKQTTWEEITKTSKSKEPILETDGVDISGSPIHKVVSSFSKQNLKDSIVYNNTGHKMFLSINFMNYVDSAIKSIRGEADESWLYAKNGKFDNRKKYEKSLKWLRQNLFEFYNLYADKIFLGTGPTTDDMIIMDKGVVLW